MPISVPAVRIPSLGFGRRPWVAVGIRLGIAIGLLLFNWLLVWIERGSYIDNYDGTVSAVDALYYTTVTLSTTGYGDITPITTGARLINALVVTPMRLLFVIVLVGTTIKSLTRESRHEFRLARWRRRMKNHVIVIGYGTKGRNAVRALVDMGTSRNDIVMIDRNDQAITAATLAGHTAIVGSGTDEDTLREALVERARAVIVAVNRDDTAILATLTVRRMAPNAEIIATAHEAHNAELLEQSGARSVIVSSETAGRLLGLATDNPGTVRVVEDLLSFGPRAGPRPAPGGS